MGGDRGDDQQERYREMDRNLYAAMAVVAMIVIAAALMAGVLLLAQR